MDSKYKFVRCEHCNESKFSTIMIGKDLLNDIDGEFFVVKCDNCGFVYTNPRPIDNELTKYYPDDTDYFKPQDVISCDELNPIYLKVLSCFLGYNHLIKTNFIDKLTLFPIYALYLKKSLEIEGIPKFIPNGKLLDVGCSYGKYLCKMKNLGWDVKGVELNKKAANYGIKELCLNITNENFIDFKTDEKFDIITMRMVLEHLPNPSMQLKKAKSLLKKNGKLIIIVPNFDGVEFQLFKEYCYALQVPTHFNHFTPKTIQKFCEKNGLNIKRIVFHRVDKDFIASAEYKAISTNAKFKDHILYNILKNRYFRPSIVRILVNINSILGLSSRMTIWACNK